MAKICDVCGKLSIDGMTNDGGDFYIHEGECFEKYMDEAYGKHRWMGVLDDGAGGFYVVSDDNVAGHILGTGIYYTTWEEEGDEKLIDDIF